MIQEIETQEEFDKALKENDACLFYFSHDNCNVCKVLKPKVHELLEKTFPRMSMYYVNTIKHPNIAGQNAIFTVPTLTIYFDQKEYIRKSRNISLAELENEINRPYSMIFES